MQLRPLLQHRIALVLLTGALVGLASVHARMRVELRQARQELKQKTVATEMLRSSLQKDQKELANLHAAMKREEADRKAIERWGRVTRRPFIPPIATVAGVQVGRDTIERLEQRFGPGYAYLGGHPRGAREWRSRKTGWYLDADGFSYTPRNERVLDSISVGTTGYLDDPKAAIPTIAAPRERLLFMGGVSLGMTRQQVREALEDKLPAPQIRDGTWVWIAKGFSALNTQPCNDVHEWTAILTFAEGKLTRIEVRSEG